MGNSQKSKFQKQYRSQTCQLFEDNKQEFIIIWGDPNNNSDNYQAKKLLIDKYPFLEERIYKFEDSIKFRRQSTELSKRNILFLMSGGFANQMISGKSNLEWVNSEIQKQNIHSKSIILFTSMSTIQNNNWTIQNLQQKFKYVTQLSIDYDSLLIGFDKMIFNRIHRSFVQCNQLDFYFRSKTQSILDNFQNTEFYSFKNLQISESDLVFQFEGLCEYLKTCEVQAPLTLFLSEVDRLSTAKLIESCLYKNGIKYKKKNIIIKILNLYTQETPIYRILNLSLNTMNPKIYQYLNQLYKLFSKCLYLFDDKQEQSKIQLYRGAAIQKYQYDTLYDEFQQNKLKNNPTFIVFPQFLSTSVKKQIAKDATHSRYVEVDIKNTGREQHLDYFSKLNKEYLKSEDFRKAYKVLILIDAQFDEKNKNRPKSIQLLSKYKEESEYLFQPFQAFKVESMEQGTFDGQLLEMKITYII
ncbi:hypothetical protein ABPG74_013038 [Tetrahymena malaccensis]